MNDLISRSALLAYLENEKRKIKADSKKYRIHEEAVAGMKASLQAIENKVNEMPTAYDVEEVVAELPTYEFGVSLLNTEKYVKLSDLKKKLDAIRKGGVE